MLLIKSSGGQISSEFVSDFKEAINVIDVIERLKIENMKGLIRVLGMMKNTIRLN